MLLYLIIYVILRSRNIEVVKRQEREKRCISIYQLTFFFCGSNEVSLSFLLTFNLSLAFQLPSHFELISGCKI